ncbi:MAG: hypothetical protein J6K21_02085 [Bacilli bacterium]|nr:hypothetical protein [Bacilli bacterium]
MRSKKSTKNAFISVFYYFLNSIFTFISKTVLITYLGIEYNGLNSLTTNLLGVLNIAELGLSTAVGYSLYKPLAQNDKEKINEILTLYKYLYRIVAIVVGFLGIITAFLLPLFVHSNLDMKTIELSFILYLIATVISYLFTYLNVLPSADQKNYMIVKLQGNGKLIKNIVQIIELVIFKNYYIWLIIEILFNIIIYTYTNYKIKKDYNWYNSNISLTFKELLKKYKSIVIKTRDLICHKIGGLVVYQSDNIVISYFCNLAIVGTYSNYLLIFTLLTGCIEQAFAGVTASIGNLIVEKDNKKVYETWKELHIIFIFIATLFSFLFYELSKSFITIWVGSEYLLEDAVVFAIALNIMFKIIKCPIDKFKEAYGIFWDKGAPLFEATINLIVSIVLAKKIGILGVVIGTIVSNMIITAMWKPYVVFKYGFKEKIKKYIFLTLRFYIIGILSVLIANFIGSYISIEATNIFNLILLFIVYGLTNTIIIFVIFMIDKEFRNIVIKYIKMLKNILKPKKIENS